MNEANEAAERLDAVILKYERIIRDCIDAASRIIGGPTWTKLRAQADAYVCVVNDLRELRSTLTEPPSRVGG